MARNYWLNIARSNAIDIQNLVKKLIEEPQSLHDLVSTYNQISNTASEIVQRIDEQADIKENHG
jgi:hypothetical protein